MHAYLADLAFLLLCECKSSHGHVMFAKSEFVSTKGGHRILGWSSEMMGGYWA